MIYPRQSAAALSSLSPRPNLWPPWHKLTGWTMSVIRTSRTFPGASLPGLRIASLERLVASPPSNVPPDDDGGGLLLGFIALQTRGRVMGWVDATCSSHPLSPPPRETKTRLRIGFQHARGLPCCVCRHPYFEADAETNSHTPWPCFPPLPMVGLLRRWRP